MTANHTLLLNISAKLVFLWEQTAADRSLKDCCHSSILMFYNEMDYLYHTEGGNCSFPYPATRCHYRQIKHLLKGSAKQQSWCFPYSLFLTKPVDLVCCFFKAWLYWVVCSRPRCELGHDDASSGSWRVGKLDQRDAPLFTALCCDAVSWMYREKSWQSCPRCRGVCKMNLWLCSFKKRRHILFIFFVTTLGWFA